MNTRQKLGIIRETKNPPDRRVPLTPEAARKLLDTCPGLELAVQPSELRCFKNGEYTREQLHIQENLDDCTILMGVKEVRTEALIPDKTYLFFAHVAKKQPYNRKLLRAILEKNITLIDYEYLTRTSGERVVAFGHWAGVVGAYNGLRAYGLRTGRFDLQPAHEYRDMQSMYKDMGQPDLGNIKILVTGGGRVAHGALQTLRQLNLREVSPEDYLSQDFDEPVMARIDPQHYVARTDGKDFDLQYFFNNPQAHKSIFKPYTKVTDMLVTAHFWHPASPVFMAPEDMQEKDFRIGVIADISCDINGPIPSTLRASTIASPFYDYNPHTRHEEKALQDRNNITVMAVDNLPGELPRDASESFAGMLLDHVMDALLNGDTDGILARATIAQGGKLTTPYAYLQDYADGKE